MSRYGIEEVDGKGLGVIAKLSLEAGDLVFAETPQLTFDTDSSQSMRKVKEEFQGMPSTVKDEIMSLEDAWSSRGRKTLRGIIETNGIECEIAGRSSNTKAVCMNLSRLNHSCNANCDYSWNERDQQMEIYAQTAISEGEELCISYIDVREPRQVRQQMLQDNWQFRCSCSKCSMRLHSASDKRRLRMGELSALLYSSRSSARKLRIAKKLLKLYKEEDFAMSLVLPSSGRVTGDFASCTGYRSCFHPTQVVRKSYKLEACQFGYDSALELGDIDTAPRFARLGLRCSLICRRVVLATFLFVQRRCL